MQLNYQETSLLSLNQIESTAQTLSDYVLHLQQIVKENTYDQLEASINLSSDPLLPQVKLLLAEKSIKKVKYIIDIGIGGSNLGTKAVYDALQGSFDLIQPKVFPKIIFLDTNSPGFLARLETLIRTSNLPIENWLINIISKSGGTTETIANFEVVFEAFQKRFYQDVSERVVVTTDEGSKLYQMAQEKQISVLTLPKNVGGRYSVLSNVGLFPLTACSFDTEQLVAGAADMRTQCLTMNVKDNPALASASILYLHSQTGKNINDNFFFEPELESIGKWYRQLMGESIGKEHDINQKVVFNGITPTVSIGSTDLHSMGQLYLGGPKDKITTFISAQHHQADVTIPKQCFFPLVDNIAQKKASQLMFAILEGTKAAYQKQHQPFMHVVLDRINTYELGAFLQFKMIEMMYLGKLMQVNPFDQPHVELYKVVTKQILNQ